VSPLLAKLYLTIRNKLIPRIRYLFIVLIPAYFRAVKSSRTRQLTFLSIICILSISLTAFFFYANSVKPSAESISIETITYREFKKAVESGNVLSVIDYNQNAKKITGRFKNNKLFITDNPQSNDIKKYLLEQGVAFEDKPFIETLPNILVNILVAVLPMVFAVVLIGLVMGRLIKKQYAGKDSKFDIIKKCNITFDDVAGNEEAKQNMMELVDFLTNPDKFLKYGVIPPKGTVLFGPPGTGKTLLAKALAGTAGVPFVAVSGSDFVEKFVGVGASRIRQLFQFARKISPCIIFIDEIDALGKRSSNNSSGSGDEKDRTINQILVEIDGFSGSEGIIVIAATNRLDMLDPALLRSGRFDRQIQVALPDVEARASILELHAKNKPLSSDVDLKEVARMTVYMSGADLANVMNEAGIYAIRNGHSFITMKDIDLAVSKIQAGEEKRSKKNIKPRDKEITAFHEAGHALVAKLVSGVTVSKVTIIPTTKGAGGYTLFVPDEKMFSTKKDLLNDIAIFLGGRAAEEIVFGENEVTNGASDDLRKATQIAVDIVKNYGMSQTIGLVSFLDAGIDAPSSKNMNAVEQEVKDIIEGVYKETKELLKSNSDCLRNIASLLLERETIYRKDIDNIVERTMFKRNE